MRLIKAQKAIAIRELAKLDYVSKDLEDFINNELKPKIKEWYQGLFSESEHSILSTMPKDWYKLTDKVYLVSENFFWRLPTIQGLDLKNPYSTADYTRTLTIELSKEALPVLRELQTKFRKLLEIERTKVQAIADTINNMTTVKQLQETFPGIELSVGPKPKPTVSTVPMKSSNTEIIDNVMKELKNKK